MSQAGILSSSGGGFSGVETLTTNDGNHATSAGNNINVLGLGVSADGVSSAPNIYTTSSGANVIIHDTQAQFLTNYTATSEDPYIVTSTDYYIAVNVSGGPTTVKLPNAPTTNRIIIIKDVTGSAATNNITITTVGGEVTIDGSVTYVLNTNYASVILVFDGFDYEVLVGSEAGNLDILNGNVGTATPTAGAITVTTGASDANGTALFTGSGSTLTLSATDSTNNTAWGTAALSSLSSGTGHNTVLGSNAGNSITSGHYNILIGSYAGAEYTSTESNNIILNAYGAATGVAGDQGWIRIGIGGTQVHCAIAGITGVAPISASTPQVVLCDSSGILGTISSSTSGYVLTSNGSSTPSFQALPSSGIGTLDGDSGSATGATVTIETLPGTNGGTAKFTGSGATLTFTATDSNNNTSWGKGCMTTSSVGIQNCAFGQNSLHNNSGTGAAANCVAIGIGSLGSANAAGDSYCIAIGPGTLSAMTSSSGYNVAIGFVAGNQLTTGGYNILIGTYAGNNYTSSESSNILILSSSSGTGTTGESHVLRIGNGTGTGAGQIATAYISGIYGATTSSAGTSTAVLIDNTGNLGTIASSIRYKENVKDIDRSVLNLRPVQFNYINDKSKTQEFGLIAEEVEKIFPELVIHKDGQPESVRYHELPALLLNEIQRLVKRVEFLESQLAKK